MKTSSEDNYLCIPVSVDLSYCSIHLKVYKSICRNLLGNYEHRRCLECLQLIIIILDSY